MADYDVIVIGAGMAGVNAAWKAHEAGARVAVVERERLGGTCPIKGCVPTKALTRSAEIAHQARRAGEFGVHVGEISVDFAAAVGRIRQIAAQGENGVRGFFDSLESLDVFMGEARFADATTVAVGNERLNAPKIILATGASARRPDIPGLDETGFLTSDDVTQRITELPERLLVIGAGAVGLELGQALSRLGSSVSLIEITETLLPEAEPEVGETLAEALRAEGISLLLGARITGVWSEDGERKIAVETADGPVTLVGDEILLGTGRVPAVDALDLGAAGIAHNGHGIDVGADLQTSRAGIYAAGDVVGAPYSPYTHVARRMGQEVVANVLDGAERPIDADPGPRAIFTDPEVAVIGMTEREAVDGGFAVSTGRSGFSGGKARALGEEGGFAKIVLEEGTRRILGATIVGYHGADLIHPIAVAMKAPGGVVDPILDAYHVHPTMGERVHEAAQAAA
jgi:pyruvate/2-oxoglutarate dehydrogenase complex dihydrolipoamide dehydrogenase (E3) component